jgi:hypothetical protein
MNGAKRASPLSETPQLKSIFGSWFESRDWNFWSVLLVTRFALLLVVGRGRVLVRDGGGCVRCGVMVVAWWGLCGVWWGCGCLLFVRGVSGLCEDWGVVSESV